MRLVVLVTPYDSQTEPNRHYELLYNVLKRHGYEILPFTFANACRYNRRAIWHIHWIDIFYIGLLKRNGAQKQFLFFSCLRFAYFLFSLALCKISGLKIVWTIHNAESHTRPGSFFEKLVTRILLFFADKVTALNNHIRKVMEERYDFNNIFLLRQGLYEGCYANTITREQARQKLGLEKNDFVLLFLGKVEEYKGIDIAIEALDLVADDSVKLLIAGRINRSLPYGAHVIELAAKNKNIIVHNNFIPDDDVQIYFKAADYSIYPYRRIDNSGVLFLTLTFSVPTIMRGAGGITEIFDLNPKAAILIDHADKHEIARAIKKARTTRVDSSEFAVFNQELSWKNLEKEITDCFNSL